MDSLRGSSVKLGTIQRKLPWPLRKDDTRKSRSVNTMLYYHHRDDNDNNSNNRSCTSRSGPRGTRPSMWTARTSSRRCTPSCIKKTTNQHNKKQRHNHKHNITSATQTNNNTNKVHSVLDAMKAFSEKVIIYIYIYICMHNLCIYAIIYIYIYIYTHTHHITIQYICICIHTYA